MKAAARTAALTSDREAPLRQARAAAGFSLLEVIVALALLASTGAALFAWFGQSMANSAVLRQRLQDAQLIQQATGLMANVNPAVQQDGEQQLFDLHVAWRSERIAPERAVSVLGSPDGAPWRVSLFKVTVRAQRGTDRLEFDLLKLGQRRTSTPAAAL
jgi:general secretion pathway protein I